MTDRVGEITPKAATGSAVVLRVEAFEPTDVRPWKFHNRSKSGLDDASISDLAESIKRSGQQQLGLARRLPAGDTHLVEAIFGVRRLEACRLAGVTWRAEVRDASFSDADCAALMHGENEWTASVSPLENAVQWKAMLDAGVFVNQSALAAEIGCHRGTVSRAVRTATALFAEEWLARLVRPVLHEFTGRSADRLADAYAGGMRAQASRRRAQQLEPGEVGALDLYDALFAPRGDGVRWNTVFMRRKGGGYGRGENPVQRRRGLGRIRAAARTDASGGRGARRTGRSTARRADVTGERRPARPAARHRADCRRGAGVPARLARGLPLGDGARERPRLGPDSLRRRCGHVAPATRRLAGCRGSGGGRIRLGSIGRE